MVILLYISVLTYILFFNYVLNFFASFLFLVHNIGRCNICFHIRIISIMVTYISHFLIILYVNIYIYILYMFVCHVMFALYSCSLVVPPTPLLHPPSASGCDGSSLPVSTVEKQI